MSSAASSAVGRPAWSTRIGRWAPGIVLLGLVTVVGYLTVVPLIRLQYLALEDGAQGYREAFSAPGIWEVVRWTIVLGLGSLVIAVVLGTALAWAAYSLPPGLGFLRILPIFPIIVPAVASVLGWAFLFSPVPGYLNQLLRTLPWWNDLTEGPVDVYSIQWIVIITGLALTSFVYIFVSAGLENINDELIEAAYVSGSSQAGVFFKVILPLLRPALVYGTGVALLLGLGQFTAPLLLGRTQNISVLTTEMYFATAQIEPAYGVAAALGSPLLVFGIIVLFVNRVLLGDPSRFVTHGSKGGFRRTAREIVARRVRDHRLHRRLDPPAARRAGDRLVLAILERGHRPEHVDTSQLARDPGCPGRHGLDQAQRLLLASPRSRSSCRWDTSPPRSSSAPAGIGSGGRSSTSSWPCLSASRQRSSASGSF